MADESNIPIAVGEEPMFIGADHVLRFTIYSNKAHTTVQNISGFTWTWTMRATIIGKDPHYAQGPIAVEKTSAAGGITVSGVYNSDPAVNLQKVLVTIVDTDTENLKGGIYAHALKRADDGQERPVAFGTVQLKSPAAR